MGWAIPQHLLKLTAKNTMKKVTDALNVHLATFATAQGLLVAWPSTDFTPTTGTYLRPYLIPGQPFAKTLGPGGYSEQSGIFYINIISPLGTGVGDASELADLICSHFPRGLELSLGVGSLPLRVRQSYQAIQREEETTLFTQVQVKFYVYR
jgi:hypothetical protein